MKTLIIDSQVVLLWDIKGDVKQNVQAAHAIKANYDFYCQAPKKTNKHQVGVINKWKYKPLLFKFMDFYIILELGIIKHLLLSLYQKEQLVSTTTTTLYHLILRHERKKYRAETSEWVCMI